MRKFSLFTAPHNERCTLPGRCLSSQPGGEGRQAKGDTTHWQRSSGTQRHPGRGGLCSGILSLSSGKGTPGWYSPSCAEAGRCTWGQDEAVQRELEPTRVNSLEVSRFGVLVSAKCYCEILIYI